MFDQNKRRPKGSVTAAVADRFQGLQPRSVGDEGSDGPDLRRGQVHSAAGDVGRDHREAGGAGTASGALDVGTDSFNDADDEPFDPTEFIEEDDEF